MKNATSIHEHELDGALNALFLEKYSRDADESLARFFMEQEYNAVIDSKKEAALLVRLNGTQSGGRNILLILLGLFIIIAAIVFMFVGKQQTQKEKTAPIPTSREINSTKSHPQENPVNTVSEKVSTSETKEEKKAVDAVIPIVSNEQQAPENKTEPQPSAYIPETKTNPTEEKELPYFSKDGLAYFAKVKERMIKKLMKIDDFLYCKTEPGATFYKSREVIIAPFVMSNFPITNQQYKVFLADLAMQGRVDDMKKCLPKTETWKEYGCFVLAKNYFEKESYNDFPVVNVSKEACVIFTEWLETEMNIQLEEQSRPTKSKIGTSKNPASGKKKQVVVRLPYDYEWIYSADAAYTLIPNCGGYNTIYDATEGLVDKNFYKRTSQISKRDQRKETRMDQLSDVNRWGMTETEMLTIYKEAMDYRDGHTKSIVDFSDPATYPNNIEACCLAGHVCELIKDKDEGMTVRGCCWKSKDDYLKMMADYKKNGASPFIGFRVMIINAERGSDKDPFW